MTVEKLFKRGDSLMEKAMRAAALGKIQPMTTLKLRPLENRVVVVPQAAETTTPGGLIIPDNAKEKPRRGKVVAVGPGAFKDDGTRRAMDVRVGDVVLYGKYVGNEIKIDGQEIQILREEDILGVVE